MTDVLWLLAAVATPPVLFGIAVALEAWLFPPHKAAEAARGELQREPGW